MRLRLKVRWSPQSRQRFLCCLVCGSWELCARGLCRVCYNAVYRDECYFGGRKERVLQRDERRCRVCAVATGVVHHRKPGVDQEQWLITLCPACHATIERLRQLDRYLPPLLLQLWREKHPEAGCGQLQFDLDGVTG